MRFSDQLDKSLETLERCTMKIRDVLTKDQMDAFDLVMQAGYRYEEALSAAEDRRFE